VSAGTVPGAPETEGPKRRPPNRVELVWRGDERFDAGRPGGPTLRLDGTGATGQGPVDALLSALAACGSIDVAQILAKRRTPVATMAIAVTGHRAEVTPRRLEHVRLDYAITGDGIDRVHAERAVYLALGKYCSVRDSLARDIVIEVSIALNGEAGEVHPLR
jgi:putative redox protein